MLLKENPKNKTEGKVAVVNKKQIRWTKNKKKKKEKRYRITFSALFLLKKYLFMCLGQAGEALKGGMREVKGATNVLPWRKQQIKSAYSQDSELNCSISFVLCVVVVAFRSSHLWLDSNLFSLARPIVCLRFASFHSSVLLWTIESQICD